MATTYNITTAFTDPEGYSVTTGTLRFVVEESTSETLKGLEATVTPSVTIPLVAATYKVYYIDTNNLEKYIGEINVTKAAALTTLL